MIERRTVFILGAGASMPYGMPSGDQLRRELCGASFAPNGVHSNLLESTVDIARGEIAHFADFFRKSNQRSIDAFLSRQERFRDIGKFCIAAELCSRERQESVIGDIEDDWYALLLEALTRDAITLQDVRRNQIRIVTFNYDRSLEYYLFESLKHTFPNATDADILTTIDGFGILHVYGCLAEFSPVPRAGARQYIPATDANSLRTAANGILVIPEARDDAPVFQHAREAVFWSQALCFLGFGFDFLNLARLRIPSVLNEMPQRPRLLASIYGKTDAEVQAYKQRICPDQGWSVYNERNVMAIRKSGILL